MDKYDVVNAALYDYIKDTDNATAHYILCAASEKEFQHSVVDLAKIGGWLVHHGTASSRTDNGFPDLVLIWKGCVIYAELKAEDGELTPEQEIWREWLENAGQAYFLWKPTDWGAVFDILYRKRNLHYGHEYAETLERPEYEIRNS